MFPSMLSGPGHLLTSRFLTASSTSCSVKSGSGSESEGPRTFVSSLVVFLLPWFPTVGSSGKNNNNNNNNNNTVGISSLLLRLFRGYFFSVAYGWQWRCRIGRSWGRAGYFWNKGREPLISNMPISFPLKCRYIFGDAIFIGMFLEGKISRA